MGMVTYEKIIMATNLTSEEVEALQVIEYVKRPKSGTDMAEYARLAARAYAKDALLQTVQEAQYYGINHNKKYVKVFFQNTFYAFCCFNNNQCVGGYTLNDVARKLFGGCYGIEARTTFTSMMGELLGESTFSEYGLPTWIWKDVTLALY